MTVEHFLLIDYVVRGFRHVYCFYFSLLSVFILLLMKSHVGNSRERSRGTAINSFRRDCVIAIWD